VNALAASDAVLVPVSLDGLSVEAVPRMLKNLELFRGNICSELAWVGIIANRVKFHSGKLVSHQSYAWDQLAAKCKHMSLGGLHLFKARVKDESSLTNAANCHRIAALSEGPAQSMFLDLAHELKKRMPIHERRRSPALH
jgi:cellulose biosynthesis protein BcsQ